jgi:RNA polymerase sigma-70 factor, ECF subfamily
VRAERRAVLVLRYYDDLPVRDIAALVGCPEATVRTRLHRGLADLRKELDR